jgi:hypothetical protein
MIITRGYGADQMIITRGYGLSVVREFIKILSIGITEYIRQTITVSDSI